MGSTAKKQTILTQAQLSFSEKGFWDTHMSEIAKAAGVAEGTIFYHFRTKEDLFLEVLRQFKDQILQGFEEHFKANTFVSGLAMLEGVISYYLTLAGRMQESFLLLHRHHSYQLAKDNPECWQVLEDIYTYLISAFEQPVRTGQKDGSIRPSSPKKTALLLFTLVDGVVRLETYNLYTIDSLSQELVESCRLMVQR
jgi:TetR/AcrR family transcriptional regulator, fatty acid metabolism regulator protein